MREHNELICPYCLRELTCKVQPSLSVDIIIEHEDHASEIILVKRKYPPYGWAIPGGFVDYGEAVEVAAVREALEETSLHITLERLLGVYSRPGRDPRRHTVTVVFVAHAEGPAGAADDAADLDFFSEGNLPVDLVFDHAEILSSYFESAERQLI